MNATVSNFVELTSGGAVTLTGNLGVPGGGFGPRHGSTSHGHGLGSIAANDRRSPGDYIIDQMPRITEALVEGRIRVMLLWGTNMVSSFADTNRVVAGLRRCDLVAVHDLFVSDTARECADACGEILADPDRKVSDLYGMIHPQANDTLTVRSVFFIDPKKKVRAMITYPASTGRNFQEILRVLDSLQLTDSHQVATPADWKDGDDCVIVPALQDQDEMKKKFPKGWKALKPYLRMTPQPNK